MADQQPEKLEGTSLDISAENRARLKQLFPTVFTENLNVDGTTTGSIDFEKLKAEIGSFSDVFESRRERYSMDWPGKRDALRVIQTKSYGTLKPCKEESVNYDITENLFIEGDNLEVLKLLQKSYYGKVKMIYIDPPYNTGKEFIYPDNYTESLETYLEYAGLIDSEGKKFSTNTPNEGRFHTKWLNMMYPRLYLARNILNDDGVIFVSISDEENKNLIKLLDEIFGEENQLACLIWNKQHSQQQGVFKKYHEYVLVYAKNKENINNISGGEGIIDAGALKKISRGNPASEFIFPAGIRFEAQDGTELTGTFGDSEKVTVIRGKLKAHNGKTTEEVVLSAGWTQKNQMTKYFNNEVVLDSKGQKVIEFYFNSAGKLKCKKERSRITPPTILPEYGMVSEQTAYIENLFGMSVFDNPKPVKMLQDFLNWFTDDGDIVVDFFAGSATMADSILTNGNAISFILVQLPEIINASSESGKNAIQMGYKTIADIGKERIRRVINKLNEKDSSVLTLDDPSIKDRGFKVLKLDKSNFKQWQTLEPSTTPEQIAEQLELHIDHINTEATQEDLLYEILLKAGFKLTEKVEIKTISNKTVYSVAEGALLLCLEETITKELIDAIVEMEPFRFYCLDSSFGGNDQLKANAVQTFNARNMQKEKHNQIAFKTI